MTDGTSKMVEEYSDGGRVYPRRYSDDTKLSDRKHREIVSALDELKKLEVATRPAGGPTTAVDKDRRAFEALRLAGSLVDALAGWAIDHQVGLALKNLQFVPPHPINLGRYPEFREAIEAVDNHEHEREGALTRKEQIGPDAARLALINLLRGNSGGFPDDIQEMALVGFEALNYSEVLPLMEPAHSSRKVKLQELRLQLEALALIEYRVAHGMKKFEAQDEVAGVFNVERETLRTWDKRVREGLGAVTVGQSLFEARDAAVVERSEGFRFGQAPHSGRQLFAARMYGQEGLNEAAGRWRAFKGFS